jgi:hypothetical protein
MMAGVSAELIAELAENLQAIAYDREQAVEIAAEVTRLNKVVLAAAPSLSFEVEPVHFAALLDASGQ